MVGRLERVDLRQVWVNEAKDFTTWLAKYLDILSEHIGLDLSLLEREKSIGTLSADILAEGPTGETVIIENQLEKQTMIIYRMIRLEKALKHSLSKI